MVSVAQRMPPRARIQTAGAERPVSPTTAPVRMRSRVNWTVLGLLLERPSYGYELYQRIGRRFPADVLDPYPGHVYHALDVLFRSGLIEEIGDPEADCAAATAPRPLGRRRQPRIHYRVTAEGAREFRMWLAREMRTDRAHDEFIGQLAIAAGMGRAELLQDLLGAYEDACASEAQALPMAGADGRHARSPDALVRRLSVAARRAALEAQMGWLRYARKEIQAFQRGEAGE